MKIKAYAVLGLPDNKPMPFGSLRGREGSYSVFEKKEQALAMAAVASWKVVPCTIMYSLHNEIKKTARRKELGSRK